MEHTSDEVLKAESLFQFTEFNSESAYILGQLFANKIILENIPVTVDIFAYGKTMFRFSHDLVNPDKENWIRRKRNVVLHFHHSSKYMYLKAEKDGQTLQTKYRLSAEDYAAVAGSFPLRIKNNGVIGAVTVSGLQPDEDHRLVLQCLKEFFCLKDPEEVESQR